MKFLIIVLTLNCMSCKYVIKPSHLYSIDKNGVASKSGCTIETMSISQFNRDHNNFNDIRPNNHNEVTRYCCWLNNNSKGSSKISFSMTNRHYSWFLCKPDESILENDSLNNLTVREKLEYIKRKELLEPDNKNYLHQESLPFKIKKGYVYQIFGLCDVEGSYYFCLDANNKLIVQYFDSGPW